MPRNTTNYIISGSKFYRLASKSWIGLFGTNLQNVEKSIRRIYLADAGKILNQRDLEGAEALIVAFLCEEGLYRKLFLYKIKVHVFIALHLFKKQFEEKIKYDGLDIHCDFNELCNTPIENLKLNPWWKQIDTLIKESDGWPPSERYYYIAKMVTHSSNYGIGAGMFCLNTLDKSRGKIVLQKKDAEYFLDMYHSLFPEIRRWHRQVEEQVRTTRILYNLLGYPIQFTGELETESHIKECFSAIPQSTVACITRQAFRSMFKYIVTTGCDWDLMNDCHDSYLVQCPDSTEEIHQCQSMMKEFMEINLENNKGEKFKMSSEGATGKNWGSFDSIKNPEGLKKYII